MSKYQKSYKVIETFVRENSEHHEGSYQEQYHLDLIRELVDRSTPKKPKGYSNGNTCGKCDYQVQTFGNRNYCANCGQATDWGVEID